MPVNDEAPSAGQGCSCTQKCHYQWCVMQRARALYIRPVNDIVRAKGAELWGLPFAFIMENAFYFVITVGKYMSYFSWFNARKVDNAKSFPQCRRTVRDCTTLDSMALCSLHWTASNHLPDTRPTDIDFDILGFKRTLFQTRELELNLLCWFLTLDSSFVQVLITNFVISFLFLSVSGIWLYLGVVLSGLHICNLLFIEEEDV